MAFTQSTFAPVGPQSAEAPSVYSYSSSDDLSSVLTSGYFTDKENQLEQGDWILFYIDGGSSALLRVSSDTSTVTSIDLAGDSNNLGWEFLIDTQYVSPASSLDIDADTWIRIPNTGFQIPSATNMPDGVSSWYDAVSDKFVFPVDDAWFNLSINFGIQPSTANATVQVRGLVDSGGGLNFYGPTVQPLAVDAGESNVFSIQTAFPITQNVRDFGVYYEVNCSSDAKLYL